MSEKEKEPASGFDLQLATMEDITDELKRRYDGVVLITVGEVNGQDDNLETPAIHWSGGQFQAWGLLQWASGIVRRM